MSVEHKMTEQDAYMFVCRARVSLKEIHKFFVHTQMNEQQKEHAKKLYDEMNTMKAYLEAKLPKETIIAIQQKEEEGWGSNKWIGTDNLDYQMGKHVRELAKLMYDSATEQDEEIDTVRSIVEG